MKIICKAILFDMDGTLVDSTAVVESGWGWWAKRHQIPLEEILRFSHGRPTASTFEHFLPGVDHTAELAEMLAFEETELGGIRTVPGVELVVQAAQLGAWGVVTSAPRALAVTRIVAAGLPVPAVLVPIDEIRNGKPDPEGFLLAAEKLGVNPTECLVFEDTKPGIQAGINAGMQVIGLLTTVTADDLAHRPLVRDFRDVHVTALAGGFEVVLQET
ncbi:MAG: HAD-IA family hydrolase [Bryobacteraceae bacterium]